MKQEELEATGKQRSMIARLGYLLSIDEPIETGFMTMAQAGRQIRHLYWQLRLKSLSKSKKLRR